MSHEKIPPQVIEKWRSEFEKEIPNANTAKCPDGYYIIDSIDAMWQGFLLARSTVVIELPEETNGQWEFQGIRDCRDPIE